MKSSPCGSKPPELPNNDNKIINLNPAFRKKFLFSARPGVSASLPANDKHNKAAG
jgi:hypothetical protein